MKPAHAAPFALRPPLSMLRALLTRAARRALQAAELPRCSHARHLCAGSEAAEPPGRTYRLRDRKDALPPLQQVAGVREVLPDRPEDRQEHKQVQMNAQIMACDTPEAVLALVTPLLPSLGRWSLVVALQRVASAAKQQRKPSPLRRDAQPLEPLLLALQWQLGSLEPSGFAGVLSACGMLGVKPPADWLQSFWRESAPALDRFGPKELTTTLFACGRLGLKPPGDWQSRFFSASAKALPQYDSQCFANTLFACGAMGLEPPQAWLRVFWPACAAELPTFKPLDLSELLHACARMKLTPPEDVMEPFWSASQAKMRLFTPMSLSKLFYGCAVLRLAPSEEWMHAFWRKSTELLPTFTGQSHANMLESSAQLDSWFFDKQEGKQRFTPPNFWLDRFFPASAASMCHWVPQDFVTTLHGLGQLGIMPPRDWLHEYWKCSAELLPEFTPRSCATTLLACAQLNITPPDAWLRRFWRTCETKLQQLIVQDMSNIMFAVAVLELWSAPLPPKLWARLCESLSARPVQEWNQADHLHARQMYHVYQTAAFVRPGTLAAPPAALLEAMRQSWLEQAKSKKPRAHDGLLADIAACLTTMGVSHTTEGWCEAAERFVDIAVNEEGLNGPRVALMVDKAVRRLRNGQPSGPLLLRNRALEANEWRVVSVGAKEWTGQSPAEKEEILRTLLRKAQAASVAPPERAQ